MQLLHAPSPSPTFFFFPLLLRLVGLVILLPVYVIGTVLVRRHLDFTAVHPSLVSVDVGKFYSVLTFVSSRLCATT